MKEVRISFFEMWEYRGAPEYIMLLIAKRKGFPVTGNFLLKPDWTKILKWDHFHDTKTDEIVIRWEEIKDHGINE